MHRTNTALLKELAEIIATLMAMHVEFKRNGIHNTEGLGVTITMLKMAKDTLEVECDPDGVFEDNKHLH